MEGLPNECKNLIKEETMGAILGFVIGFLVGSLAMYFVLKGGYKDVGGK